MDVIEGNDVIVNCSANGKPAPNVTWTTSVSDTRLNQSVSSALLVIKNRRKDSNKDYTCTANSVGDFTAIKNLKLNVMCEYYDMENKSIEISYYILKSSQKLYPDVVAIKTINYEISSRYHLFCLNYMM